MKRTLKFNLASFVFVGAFFACPMHSQQHTIGGTLASPIVAVVGQASVVTISASIPDPAVIAGSVNLLRVDSSGNATVVGVLHDDGDKGDLIAGDGVFTYQATLNELAGGPISFQISAAFRGSLLRVRAAVSPVFVQIANAPTVALANLAGQIASGNITAALASFLDSDKANLILKTLGASSQQKLANAFAAAQLVRSSGGLRVYHLLWPGPSGNALTLEVALEPNNSGDWIIVAW